MYILQSIMVSKRNVTFFFSAAILIISLLFQYIKKKMDIVRTILMKISSISAVTQTNEKKNGCAHISLALKKVLIIILKQFISGSKVKPHSDSITFINQTHTHIPSKRSSILKNKKQHLTYQRIYHFFKHMYMYDASTKPHGKPTTCIISPRKR